MATDVFPPVIPPGPPILPAELRPNVEHLVTEDGAPVDNLFSEKQMRLLTEPLYASWTGPDGKRLFLACANVGLFYAVRQPPIVPDVFLSLDVEAPKDWWDKQRSYFFWEFGKAPDVAIEVVSNLEGEEAGRKMEVYAKIGVTYYVIWDPLNLLKEGRLRVLSLHEKTYQPLEKAWFPAVGLGLAIWHGTYEGAEADWLRWCDEQGAVIPTGAERAGRLAAQLRLAGIEPAR